MTADDGLELPGPDPRSPEARLRGYRTGQSGAPNWDAGDPIDGSETTLIFAEEAMAHPENRPLLCLCHLDDRGDLLGEIWFAPADIPAIVAFLQSRLTYYGQRRWLGNDGGPSPYFGGFGEAPGGA